MWKQQTLDAIVNADDLKIAPLRPNLKECGTPTYIWCVQYQGDLYVRAYSGTSSRWYQAALQQQAGQIHAAKQIFDVEFEPISDSAINESIDQAYKAKYASSSYLGSMISVRARATTIKVIPKI